MSKILVPVDFSEQAENALMFALKLGQGKDIEVEAIHIIEYPVGAAIDPVGMTVPTPYDADFLRLLRENAEKQMAEFLTKFDGFTIPEVIIEMGNPYTAITDAVAGREVDLIVMGTKGSSGFKEFLIGSNAEKVVRLAKCPVITIGQKTDPTEIKNIVYATNVFDTSEYLVSQVKQLQHMFQAKIHLLRVNTPNNFERDQLVNKALDQMAQRFMLKDYTTNIYNDVYEDQGILTFAKSINADMIAMGTHARKGIGHFIAGSLAEDVVNHAKRPIWTCHMPRN